MERLRVAEKTAKEKRACLYANAPTTSAKSNGTVINGSARSFEASVIRVWSADQISVADRETGKERRLQLSSTRGPKYVIRCIFTRPAKLILLDLIDCQTRSKLTMPKRRASSFASV